MSRKLDQVKALLTSLSQQELMDARNFASMRLGVGAASPDLRHSDDAKLILDTICDVSRSKGLDMSTVTMLEKSAQFPIFKHKIDDRGLGQFLRDATKRNRVKLRALIYLSVELLIENLQQMHVPISSRTVMSHIHRIPAVLDRNFPGYAAAGLLHLIIRRKEEPNARTKRRDERVSRPRRPPARKRSVLHDTR